MHREPVLAFLVADAGRARFMLKHGAGRYDELASFENDRPHRPRTDTRIRAYAPSGARTAVGREKDDKARAAFAAELAAAADRLVQEGKVARLALVAPPKMLAAIRRSLPARVAAKVSTVLPKDLTKLSEDDLRAALDGLVLSALPQAG